MKLIKHLITITKHRNMVVKLCFKVGIGWQGMFHDLSKYSLAELKTGAKYYTGYNSPNAIEREKFGYSSAWMHHKGRNKHHFEYWTDYSKAEKRDVPVPMPFNYIVESFCDRIAASKIYKGKSYTDSEPLDYFMRDNDGARMHPETAKTMVELLTMIVEKGEKEALKAVKAMVKEYKKSKRKNKIK